MSNFIIPLSSLPTITPIDGKGSGGSVAGSAGEIPFANMLQDAISNLTTTTEASKGSTMDLALGSSDDLHNGAIDALRQSTAVSYTAGLTSAVIRAYNELMRMQI